MADEADRAQVVEEAHRTASINAQRNQPRRAQKIRNGLIVCEDCEITISNRRLSRSPHATRCVPCQSDHEHRQKQRGTR